MTIAILKIIAVVVILVAMLVILLGIGHLSSGSFDTDSSDIDQLRKDVENKRDVVSDENMFQELVGGKQMNSETELKRN